MNLSWELRDGEREVDGFEVGPRDSDRLAGARDRDVSTLVYDGQVMIVELPGGGDVPTTREGPRGLVQSVCWGSSRAESLSALFGVSVLRHVRRRAVARHAAE